MSQQYEALPALLADALAADGPEQRADALFDPDKKMLWYKMSVGSGGLLAAIRHKLRDLLTVVGIVRQGFCEWVSRTVIRLSMR